LASITEDADAITEMHEAVLGKQLFAVDGPDGEHDLEDVVSLVDFFDCFGLPFLVASSFSNFSDKIETGRTPCRC